MKKLLLGIAVCCGISGVVCEYANGMNSISVLVNEVAKNPDDKSKLEKLVKALVDRESGSKATDEAIISLKELSSHEVWIESLNRIDCMIYAICSDWYEGYRRIHSIDYYVCGALNGEFGPYDLYSGTCCK